MTKFTTQWRLECKELKQKGRHSEILTLAAFINRCHGFVPDSKKEFKEYTPKKPAQYRETPKYPSLDEKSGVAAQKEEQRYTGDVIIGVATMHKSNAVPVINKEHATDIARMRRG